MNSPDLIAKACNDHVDAYFKACKLTGHTPTAPVVAENSFMAGFGRGMIAAGSGELIHENEILHGMILDNEISTVGEVAACSDMLHALQITVDDPGYKSLSDWTRTAIEMALEKANGGD